MCCRAAEINIQSFHAVVCCLLLLRVITTNESSIKMCVKGLRCMSRVLLFFLLLLSFSSPSLSYSGG